MLVFGFRCILNFDANIVSNFRCSTFNRQTNFIKDNSFAYSYVISSLTKIKAQVFHAMFNFGKILRTIVDWCGLFWGSPLADIFVISNRNNLMY